MFVLHQTSARQRNWWQVVNERGNIGFVPSNYVEKVKVRTLLKLNVSGFLPRTKKKSIIFFLSRTCHDNDRVIQFRNWPNF